MTTSRDGHGGRRSHDETLSVPSSLLRRVRQGGYGLLALASDDFSRDAYAYDKPHLDTRIRLVRAWSLLELLGWSVAAEHIAPTFEVPIAQHGETLLSAVSSMLTLLSDWLAEMDPADAGRADMAQELRMLRAFHLHALAAVRHADASMPDSQC